MVLQGVSVLETVAVLQGLPAMHGGLLVMYQRLPAMYQGLPAMYQGLPALPVPASGTLSALYLLLDPR